jgi:hypothetical protein
MSDDHRDIGRGVLSYRPGQRPSDCEIDPIENENTTTIGIPWLHAVVALIVFAAMAIPIGWRLFAPEPVLPLLQDGTARTAFVSGAYSSCMQKQRTLPENAELSAPGLGAYCLCDGRALADMINSNEYQAMAEGVQQTPSLLKKAETASALCTINMLPS